MFDSVLSSLNEYIMTVTPSSNNKNCFGFCKICQRSFNYFLKKGYHNCSSKPTENEQPKKTAARKQNLDLSKHCGVIIGPSGVPCMRSLTCKSHSMASKRAVKNRIKDFDVLLNAYLQSHPPKNITKAVSAAVNLDLLASNEEDIADGKISNINEIVPFKIKRTEKIYLSAPNRNNIAKYRAIFSFLDRDRSNKISRTL